MAKKIARRFFAGYWAVGLACAAAAAVTSRTARSPTGGYG